MAQNKRLKIPAVYIPAAAANLLNCGITSLAGPVGYTQTQPYLLLRHVRIMNNDSVPHVVTLYIGGTGGSVGGTEFAFDQFSLPAKSFQDWFGEQRLEATDFLTGVADAASKVTINFGNVDIGLA